LIDALAHVMEHVQKGLTETALNTLWVVLTNHFLQCWCDKNSSSANDAGLN